MTLILIKYLFLKKNYTVQQVLSNNLLDTMIMILLENYAWSFRKWSAMLENVKVIQQCLSRLMVANCKVSTIKYEKKKKRKIIENEIW